MERFCVGIDVSAKKLDVAYRGERGGVVRQRFENNAARHAALIRHLEKRAGRQVVIRVVLESTGVYGIEVATALDRAGCEVMVVNPRAAAHFAKAAMQRSKTDPLDAEMLLTFAEQMPFTRWKAPSPAKMQLRMLSRRIHALTATIAEEKNRLHAAGHLGQGRIIKRSIESTVRALDKEVTKLRAEALKLIASEPTLGRRYELLLSVKGIAEKSAIAILAELAVLPADTTDRQWVAHAGLDPRQFDSGTSVHAEARISKRGNKYLRSALYKPAMTACTHDAGVKVYAARLRERGKAPLQVHVAVMRKLLHAIHAMFASDQLFDSHRFTPAAGAVGTAEIASSAISAVSIALQG
jgi:transposase